MKIDIWYVNIPSKYENIETLKEIIGNSKVKTYSLDENNIIVEGEGWLANNDSYNYHNNYDDSEDCMWFNGEQKWFTMKYTRVLEVQKENNHKILKVLNPIVERAMENV